MVDAPDIKAKLDNVIQSILSTIERPREADIITRRYGLDGERETLEQVGETLNITRERVRQIEKATLIRIKLSLDDGKNSLFNDVEMDIVKALHEMGRAAKVDDLAIKLTGDSSSKTCATLTLLAELSSKMLLTSENDRYYAAIILTGERDDRQIRKEIDSIVKTLREHGKPVTLDELYRLVGGNYEHPSEVGAIASISKQITSLRDMWGLTKWPSVNPRNIRDKIYVVLKENGQPMHFSEIARQVKSQNFHRNNVTEQAIHNELIKDERFVLIGRGIYAFAEMAIKRVQLPTLLPSCYARMDQCIATTLFAKY